MFVMVCLVPHSSRATSPALQQSSTDTQGAVEIPFFALSNKGEPVHDLTKDEIRLIVGKQEEQIVSVTRASSEALRIGILIDISGSEREGGSNATPRALMSFLRRIVRPDVYVFVAAFTDRGKMGCDWTNDLARLDKAFSSLNNERRYGGSAIYDAIYWACTEKMATQRGRKILLVLSDMEDNSSYHSSDEATAEAIKSRTAVFPLLQIKRRKPPGRVQHVATRISDVTGGLKFDVNGDKEFESVLEVIGATLATDYSVSFISSAPLVNTKLTKIKIQCTRKGVKVVAPEGYYLPTSW
jgi:VWFA-related protein